jgi:hypothetical protein
MKAVEVEETIFAAREVASEPGAIWRRCSRTRQRRNACEVKDAGCILPLVEPEEGFNGKDESDFWCSTAITTLR